MCRATFIGIALLLLHRTAVAEATPNFKYDRQLAIELAQAYIRWELRFPNQSEVGGIDFRKPHIHSATDRAGLNFVFVAFPSSTTSWGAYATFQVCESTPLLMPNDTSTVSTFKAYWEATKRVNPTVYADLPDVCPKDEE